MASKKQPTRSSGSRSSSSRSSSSRSSSSRSSNYNRGSSRSSSRGRNNSAPQSGISSFYKAMVLLAVCGIFAALYSGGHLSGLKSFIADFSASSAADTTVTTTENTSASTTAASETATTTTTAATTASTTAKTTTSKTTITTATKKTTTTEKTTTTTKKKTTVADSGNNAKYVKSPDYESPYYIVVFTGSQSVVVYGKDSDGNYNVQTKAFTCSTGASGTPTRTGMYSILRSYRWRLLMGGVYGQYCSGISSSYLFHSVLYDKTDTSTLFENSYKNLGTAASHGCIRLSVRDAKWIYDNCPHGTQVHVVNADGPKGAELPPLKSGDQYRGWEPTDPDKNSPYNKSDSSSESSSTNSGTESSESTTPSTEATTTETTLPPPVVG